MAKDAKTIREELARPFAAEDLEWRIQVTSKDKTSGLAIPYVTNRAIQDRLDEVVGPENWYNDYKPWHGNGKKDAQICGISIYFEGKGFITKWDGAEDSDIEPIKGGLSDSMKRSAVQWGIGRVLYKMTKPLWVRIEQKGNSYVICDSERPKLNAAYLELAGQAASASRHLRAQRRHSSATSATDRLDSRHRIQRRRPCRRRSSKHRSNHRSSRSKYSSRFRL